MRTYFPSILLILSLPAPVWAQMAPTVQRVGSHAAARPFRQPPPPDCAAEDLVPTQVTLTWPDVPTEDTVAKLPTANVDLLMLNRGTQTLVYSLSGVFVAGGQRLDLALGGGIIGPSSVLTFPISLTGQGVDISDLDFSGSFFVQVDSSSTTGEPVDRAYSPTIFFHQDPTGALLAYGRQARHDVFFAGDLKNNFFMTTPPDNVMGVFDGGVGSGADTEDNGPATMITPFDSGEWQFCMRWIYQSIDSGFGEDHYQQGYLMKARGMKVVIDHDNWTEPQTFWGSQDNGCFNFTSAENSGFKVVIYAEAKLGSGNDLTVQAFDTKAQALGEDVLTWYQTVNPGGVPRRIYLENEAADESSLMGFGSFVMHWVDSHTSPGLDGPREMELVTDNWLCSSPDSSCQPFQYVQMKPGASNRKFLVGHEVGHWLNRMWTEGNMGYDGDTWDADSGGAFCEFNGVGGHAMRSRETSAGAFIEGFAHYLAALAWNDHDDTEGWFKYYKEIGTLAYEDFQADNWMVDLEGNGANPSGGVSAWMENMCNVVGGHSVEMDWLRFFWDYRTITAVLLPRPTHYDIFRHVKFTRNKYPWNNFQAYDNLNTAIGDAQLGQQQFEFRWQTLADMNGMDY